MVGRMNKEKKGGKLHKEQSALLHPVDHIAHCRQADKDSATTSTFLSSFCLPTPGVSFSGLTFLHDSCAHTKIGITCGDWGNGERGGRTRWKISHCLPSVLSSLYTEAAMRRTIYVHGWGISPLPLDVDYIYYSTWRSGDFFFFPPWLNYFCLFRSGISGCYENFLFCALL